MRFVIAGGTGLLGRALIARLTDSGHDVVVLTRGSGRASGPVHEVPWTPDGSAGAWAPELDGAEAVINLAGAGIAGKRWTAARKKLLRTSRLDSTRSLVAAIGTTTNRPRVFVQGSAVGIYGADLSDEVRDELSPPGSDFLSELAVEWESAAHPVAHMGCRLVTVRTGIVLSPDGGALPPMAKPFRMFVGGRIGTGRQFLSWITIDDWVSMVMWALRTATVHGPLNATAPEPVTNADFSRALARALRRPNLFPVPSFVLRTLFGEMADVLLYGQRVIPAKAQSLGFHFDQARLDDALATLVRR
jgi:uncharacterized protein (TIGR01777 family)